ncbi:MAG: MIP family channel protein [Oscillospiraceae bacterium]|nr:MIP family channel protein [Oscillospiraceae bacterium]
MAWKKYFAELTGTAILVFAGCGSAVFLGVDPAGGYLAVAFAFGLALIAAAYAIGNISGCHINPAVSLAVFLSKKMSALDFAFYVIAQIAGAIMGSALVRVLSEVIAEDNTGSFGANGYIDSGIDIAGGLLIEAALTFVFVLVVLGVTSDESKNGIAGIVIGFTLTLVHIIGIPFTGTSVNPARSIGPALFAGREALSQLWVFIVGPLAGAALAFCVFTLLKGRSVTKRRSR